MEIKITIQTPQLPNFVFDERGTQYDLRKDFTEEELRELCVEWVEKIIARIKKK